MMTIAKKPAWFSLPRKTRESKSKSIRLYAARTGEVIWAWNQLHYALRILFVRLVTPHNLSAGNAIWYAIKSDGSQRDVLRAALKHIIPQSTEISESADWLLDVVGKLSSYRNDAAHVPTQVNWTESAYVTASWLANPIHAKRLRSVPNLRRFHRLLRDDLYALTNYTFVLSSEMHEPGKYGALPQPPKLQSILPEEVPLMRSRKPRRKTRNRPDKPQK